MFISDFLLNSILIGFAVIFFTAFFYSFIVSLLEKENYAANRFLWIAFLLALPYLLTFYFEGSYKEAIGLILIILPIIMGIFLFLPIKGIKKIKIDTPNSKYDERDIPFSRRILKEGTDRFNEYYKKRPENLEGDLNFMSKPGLLSEASTNYNPLVYASTDAIFFAVEKFMNQVKEDKTMIDFCNKCMKCAEVCPSNSISFEDREMLNGVKRWQIDATSCFTFWCVSGTDCGKCMSVCPYSHPNNFLHNFIRFGIRNNVYFRKLALWLDDYFYGKKPLSKPIPGWMNVKEI